MVGTTTRKENKRKAFEISRNESQLNERNYDGQKFLVRNFFVTAFVYRRDFRFPILSRGNVRLPDTVWYLDSWKALTEKDQGDYIMATGAGRYVICSRLGVTTMPGCPCY